MWLEMALFDKSCTSSYSYSIHFVQGPKPTQAPLCCTKCNSPPINGQCTNHCITVWTVVQTVLTVTFNSYGDRQISTPHKIDTPEPIEKKLGTVDYVPEGTSYTKFGTNPPTAGFWANGWNITNNYFFIPFFLRHAHRSDPWMDFYTR